MRPGPRSLLRWGGFLVGATAATAALLGWRVENGSGRPSAALSVVVDRSPTLALEPAGVLLSRPVLRPAHGGSAKTVSVANATGGPLAARVVALGETDLDRVLSVRVVSGGRTLFAGPLKELRSRGSRSFVLASHQTKRLWFRAWISAGVGGGYDARAATVHLAFPTRATA